ncbi:MAG: hypothetical protein QHH75_12005 [Bacillota bacterium]|jgi:hypothetical protein|nr:hypothetical protein [Bacillota bacterium]
MTREQMELTRFEKIHLKNLLEDRISELHDIFLELTTNTQPGCFQKNVEGILAMIQKNFSILEKICRDLKLASEYDRNWLKRVLQDYDSWLDKPQPPKPHEHFIFSHF